MVPKNMTDILCCMASQVTTPNSEWLIFGGVYNVIFVPPLPTQVHDWKTQQLKQWHQLPVTYCKRAGKGRTGVLKWHLLELTSAMWLTYVTVRQDTFGDSLSVRVCSINNKASFNFCEFLKVFTFFKFPEVSEGGWIQEVFIAVLVHDEIEQFIALCVTNAHVWDKHVLG